VKTRRRWRTLFRASRSKKRHLRIGAEASFSGSGDQRPCAGTSSAYSTRRIRRRVHNACYAGVVLFGVLSLAVGLVVRIPRHGQGLPFDWNTAFVILVAAAVGGTILGKQDGNQ
jgi:hypothetical protein